MDFNADYFDLFGLPAQFRVDMDRLEKRYREIQAITHPDRYARAGEEEKRLSMQWATRVNEAYRVLKAPLPRAVYLLRLLGHPFDAGDNRAMSPEFLIEQMEWREAVSEARLAREQAELEQIHHRVKQRMKGAYEQLALFLDDTGDLAQAEDGIKRLMFLDRLLSEIDSALAALEE